MYTKPSTNNIHIIITIIIIKLCWVWPILNYLIRNGTRTTASENSINTLHKFIVYTIYYTTTQIFTNSSNVENIMLRKLWEFLTQHRHLYIYMCYAVCVYVINVFICEQVLFRKVLAFCTFWIHFISRSYSLISCCCCCYCVLFITFLIGRFGLFLSFLVVFRYGRVWVCMWQ